MCRHDKRVNFNCNAIGPRIKNEPSVDDAVMVDAEPSQPPLSSPLKRSRSQSPQKDDGNDNENHRYEKRLKTEPAEENDIVDIASLVQQAEASVMQELVPETNHNDHDFSEDIFNAINGHNDQADEHEIPQEIIDAINQAHAKSDHDDGISQDILNAINEARTEPMSHHADPQPDEKAPPDTIWNNTAHYTRRKHIIPALGSLVSKDG